MSGRDIESYAKYFCIEINERVLCLKTEQFKIIVGLNIGI